MGKHLGENIPVNRWWSSWTASQKLTGSGKVIRILFHPTDASIVYAVSESNGFI
ncbi:MAG: hypothetical protein R2778_03165 [Saprospiraceae bacterium]